MKRLTERRGELSGAQMKVLDLLEAHDDAPMSDIDKRRVLNRVRVASRSPRRASMVRLVAVAALLTSGTLLGAWGAGWLGAGTATDDVQVPPPPPTGSAAPAKPGATVVRDDRAHAPPEERGSDDDPADDDGSLGDDSKGASTPVPSAVVARRKDHASRPATSPPGEDPTLVAEALRALRQQGEPERAEELLRRYRASNPSGALSEDALALSIEAAASRDPKRATRLAREYLARYPHGRYRSTAERALRLGKAQ